MEFKKYDHSKEEKIISDYWIKHNCFKPKKTKPILPSLNLGKNKTAEQELLTQAKQGLNNRLKNFILPKNKVKDQKKLMLHSYKIKFLINNKKFNFKAKLPDYFDYYLNKKRLII